MKTFLCIVLFSSVALAGSAHRGPKTGPPHRVTGQETILRAASDQVTYSLYYTSGPGDSIGYTLYDYMTNGSANHNIVNIGGGWLTVGRMAQDDTSLSRRGSYFTCSWDYGATWCPWRKIETAIRGWSNLDEFRIAGADIIVAHPGLQVSVYGATGHWRSVIIGNQGLWPKLAVGGYFSVHIVAALTGGGAAAADIGYNRSTDAGVTYDQIDSLVFTAGSSDADGYDIADYGLTSVSIVSAGAGGEVVLLTSTDDGLTWIEQVIYDVAGPGELPPGQQEFQPDGSCAIIYDNAGNVHVVWSNYLAIGDVNSNPRLFYSIDAPVMYWSAATGVQSIAVPTQATNMDIPVGRDGNYATQPDIAVGTNDNLYVIFSQLISERDVSMNNYEHIFALGSSDGGATWGTAVDITHGTGLDASFPSLADLADSSLHIVYNSDPFAGNWISGNHPQIPVAIKYLQVLSSPLIASVGRGADQVPSSYVLRQNYPNPFNPSTTIRYELPQRAFVTLKVYNILGQEVGTLVEREKVAGSYQVQFDGSGLASGVYFYRMRAGEFVQTKKLVLLR